MNAIAARIAYLFLVASVLILFSGLVCASVYCDFNADGYADLAMGVPHQTVGTFTDAGAVSILYGKEGGLSVDNNQYFDLNSAGVPGTPAQGDQLGSTLACGDFNGDGVGDLAISAPFRSVTNHPGWGIVIVLYGTKTSGLTANGAQLWDQDSTNIPPDPQTNTQDQFGYSMAAGDFNGDGFMDLAIGIPGKPFGSHLDAGAVQILNGSNAGLTTTGNQFWDEDSPGIANSTASHGHFGASLAAGNFGKDVSPNCYDDLAIGAPDERVSGIEAAGAVHILYGSSSGLSANGRQYLQQNLAGIPGSATAFNRFGYSLAAGTFRQIPSVCGGKISDLVIGAPEENNATSQGSIYVLYGTTSGITLNLTQIWNQDTPGMNHGPDDATRFGYCVATGHRLLSGNGDYIAIGAPDDNAGTSGAAGAVHILVSDPKNGLIKIFNNRYFTEASLGGISTDGHQLGLSCATGNFNKSGSDDLAVGSSNAGVYILSAGNNIHKQFWSPDILGIVGNPQGWGFSLSN